MTSAIPTGAIHGTAVVVGTTGLLFVGPSGCGKSRLALAFLAEASEQGQFAALVADDRVFLEDRDGHLVACRPDSIRDLIEVRGSGIGRIQSIEKALMHWAIRPIDPMAAERLPPEGEMHEIEGKYRLPIIRIHTDLQAPFSAFQALVGSFEAAKP